MSSSKKSYFQQFSEIFDDFISLIYPTCCINCEDLLQKKELHICTQCRLELPLTNFHLQPTDNTITQRFWGKVPLRFAMAYLLFSKKSVVQDLLHNLKYNSQPEIGEMLGMWYGSQLKEADFAAQFDLIIPVPMHPKKRVLRGYNQSDAFAKGLSVTMEIDWQADALIKIKHTTSQTKKSRMARAENVRNVFEVKNPAQLKGKNILLVDDVITTGATLESCAEKLLLADVKSVSIATIASPL